ncbi:hypothetical protein OEZ85_011653 [Tetradesmus obliquus]|uniref:Type II secretion system protein GspE N-terminal domain-containing protein n=1 Tax=Tetradesmus obliquus TaxID=3088 RepID=A0ABY8TR20_TETOB|nr:hypothetical protein OEZ85_011653 [Tetradesmus obliquus]
MGSWQADSSSSSSSSSIDTASVSALPPSSPEALQAFLIEQGLSQQQAGQLLKALTLDSKYAACLNTQRLSQKLASLGRVLPDAAAAQLVLSEPELLLASSNQLVRNLVCMITALPGRDVVGMVLRVPLLLLVDDMPARLERITNKLVALHPSHSHTVIAGILEENPVLLLRMDYYLGDDIMLLDQLPMEIANMMVLGDESGLGHLYKYWRDKLGEPSGEQEWQEGGGSTA